MGPLIIRNNLTGEELILGEEPAAPWCEPYDQEPDIDHPPEENE